MKLPKQDKLVIPIEKLTKYALDPVRQKHKAYAFEKALGFTAENAEELAEKIRAGVSLFTAIHKLKDEWGQRYQIIMRLTGYENKVANVLTAWIDDEKADEMRLTSVYIIKKEVLDNDTSKTV